MVSEEVIITLSGGAPWGFRLQGGAEHKKPLQVAKVRKRSKACRAGLREADELVSINENTCGGLSHAQAMNLIDSSTGMLQIRVKRAPAGFQSVVLLTRAPSPRIDKEYLATHPTTKPPQATVRENHCGTLMSPPMGRSATVCLTSPPGSEAYYGETDSDADGQMVQEKQRRQKRRSPSSSPAKTSGRTSTEETSEMSGYDSAPDGRCSGGAAEGQPAVLPGVARKVVVYRPPPAEWSSQTETSAENSSVSTDDQNPRDSVADVDSGFQEPANLPPLVSPERAREALLLASRKQLVPMVGPVDNPVDEELTVTYMDKAKQAKLHRGDNVQDKQVKEARTKCRTIASLLTDAPNPHSKGVLMFKKRRQRSKKYTLTSFGSVDEDLLQDSHEDDGALPGSESEFDEEGFAAAPDSPWEGDCLELLEKKAVGSNGTESPGLTATSGKGARLFEQQRKRAAEHAKKVAVTQPPVQPPVQHPVQHPPPQEKEVPPTLALAPAPHLAHAAISQPSHVAASVPATVVSTASAVMSPPGTPPKPRAPQAPPSPQQSGLPSSTVLNRTARPFAPGFISHRAATAPVVFRPQVTKKARPSTAPSEAQPAVPSASVRVLATATPASAPPTVLSQPPPAAAVPVSLSLPSPSEVSIQPPTLTASTTLSLAPPPAMRFSAETRLSSAQKASVTTGRTGILQEARRRGNTKPMFNRPEEKKNNSPNPELLSLVQNLDERPKAGPELGFESGPEEDFFYLGAEACNFQQGQKGKVPPRVAPKPRVIPQVPQIPRLEGKGAELFARRQSRMDHYVVDSAVQPPAESAFPGPQPRPPSPTPSLPAHWKYSPNIRAPPPIGYNPLLSPSCPPGAQRCGAPKAPEAWRASGVRGGSQKEGIKALDFMRRQPYQLNSAMFTYGGGSAQPKTYQSQTRRQGGQMMGASLTPPRQIPIKAARVYEIKRFSTPTPMSAPNSLTPTVIAPRSATTLGEPIWRPQVTSPVPTQKSPSPPPARTGALPELPKISSGPLPSRAPVPFPGPAYGGLRSAMQFQSAPELSPLHLPPLRSPSVQAPKPHFVASRRGVQASMWKPGSMHP